MARSTRIFGLALAAGLLAGCEPTSPAPQILQVLVAPGTATISQGETLRMVSTVTTNPPGSPYSVTWTTSDAQAASVDSTGLVLGVDPRPGVSICATASTEDLSSNMMACATLVVQAAPVCNGPDGTLIPATDTLHVGDVAQFQIPAGQMSGRTANEIRWTLDFTATASIDSVTGVVTAVSVGATHVIATDRLETSPCPHAWRAVVIVR
jgi:uncharacterized protein YjdB